MRVNNVQKHEPIIECVVCRRTVAKDGIILRRISPKGEPGIWMCLEDYYRYSRLEPQTCKDLTLDRIIHLLSLKTGEPAADPFAACDFCDYSGPVYRRADYLLCPHCRDVYDQRTG